MGKIDTITKKYMANPIVFANAFNQILYHGDQKIDPARLTELDTTEIVIPYGANGDGVPEQKYRDVLKFLYAMTDGKTAYCVVGIENQAEIHYALPVKNGVYEVVFGRQTALSLLLPLLYISAQTVGTHHFP